MQRPPSQGHPIVILKNHAYAVDFIKKPRRILISIAQNRLDV